MNTYSETQELPIRDSFDVIVVGAGMGGLAAALAARRNGARVLLVEKTVTLGGQATTGLIHHYLPLCDGNQRKVIGGIAEEFLLLSIKYGYDTLPEYWRSGTGAPDRRYMTKFSPTAFMIALDEVVEDEGIDLLLDTLGCKPLVSDGVCCGVIVEDKSGRGVYQGKVVIDGTGDADLFRMAGVECAPERNRLTSWAHTLTFENISKAEESHRIDDALTTRVLGAALQMDGSFLSDDGIAREYYLNGPADVTRFMLDSRILYREKFIKKVGRENGIIAMLPAMPLFRTTYRIQGNYSLTPADVAASFDDSIGCASDWRKAGPVFEIPYRTLLSPDIANLIACGRCISCEGDAWEVTRVIPVAALTGQAAGTAAAMACQTGANPADIPIGELQDRLRDTGVFIKRAEC
jgi:hypothetical protein